ncbi:hypothetical protein LIER_16837 [Lithospermum erythrorhizon]|uniref:Uncharacterized protein n=1 Tax=Lithospermum erythrorhizon TaxID=34254 RepID=A0AAV3Q8G7_LITER
MEFSSSNRSRGSSRRHHVTPRSRSPHESSAFSFSSSHNFSYRNPTPTTPFASDDDRSWQGELSWNFEPSARNEGRGLGAALSPWAGTSVASAAPSYAGSRIFKKSANDYFLSRTSGGFYSSTNHYYGYSSGNHGLPSGRLELQSFEVGDNENSFIGRSYQRAQRLSTIAEGGAGKNNHNLVVQNDHKMHNYEASEAVHDREIHTIDHGTSMNNNSGNYHPRHGHMGHSVNPFENKLKSVDHGQYQHNSNIDYDNFGKEPVYEDSDDGEDDPRAARSVGLFSLFRYSTKFDIILVILGCVGALINGGSLPWYSFLFGNLVNKISQTDDTGEMMKDVEQICVLMTGLTAVVLLGAYTEGTLHKEFLVQENQRNAATSSKNESTNEEDWDFETSFFVEEMNVADVRGKRPTNEFALTVVDEYSLDYKCDWIVDSRCSNHMT